MLSLPNPFILSIYGCPPLVFHSLSHHLHFLPLLPSISLCFFGVKRKKTCTIKTSKPAVAQFPSGTISKIEIVLPKMNWLPFFVFVNHFVKVHRQCDAIWNELSSLLSSLSPPSKRESPKCNGVRIGLGALSGSGQNLLLLESLLPLLHFSNSTLSSLLLFLSQSSVFGMQVGC